MNYEQWQRVNYYPMTRLCDDVPRVVGAQVVEDYDDFVKILKDGSRVPCIVSKKSVRPA